MALRKQQAVELEHAITNACRQAVSRGEWSRRARKQLVDHVAEGRPKLPTQEQLLRASHRRHTKERQRERRQAKHTLRLAKQAQREREQQSAQDDDTSVTPGHKPHRRGHSEIRQARASQTWDPLNTILCEGGSMPGGSMAGHPVAQPGLKHARTA